MEAQNVVSCALCDQVFSGPYARRSRWRHERTCRPFRVRRVRGVSTAPAARGSAEATPSSPPGVAAELPSSSSDAFVAAWLDTIDFSDMDALGFDTDALGFDTDLLDIPDPVLDEVLGPKMTRAEAAFIVRQGRALAAVLTAEQFAQRLLAEFPHWPKDILIGIYEGCLPVGLSPTPPSPDAVWIVD